ncbi:bifunctional oligoribonuclease/PAP phosphatase NrnA [Sulfuricurvum sp. IAE1]|uniref:DHH family phosphoesterase n=1 Tax=Sulfuricurvum sp. IAE1 TaxID=2546102 RepID=UPI001052DDB7|nr:DHH family phosphoesterase [Sulfuricurvum sp. IAE1]TDA62916.1 bifunctional oligoribonuclease/PAP phosphatase NrnA [Sulfuricurvum sp. IAE1]
MVHELIDSSKHIVLIAHKNPDADSLGSACAFYSYLLRLNKKITLFCASAELDPKLVFLPWFEKVTDRFPEDADCMISFDCGSYGRLGIERDLPLINFDHHRSNDFFGTHNFIDTDAISTTQTVYDFFVANGLKINGKMALSLYAGLVDDSKCFRSPGCNARTFEMAHRLIGLGADHALCVEWLYGRNSLASLRSKGKMLKEMRLFLDGALAVFEVDAALLADTGATVAECKQVLDEALGMRHVRASLMHVERPGGGVKLSLRTSEGIDAAKIMERFGGGGHIHRAGAKIEHDDVRELVKEITMMIQKEMQ